MISLQYIRDNAEDVVERLKRKHFDASDLVKEIVEADVERRKLQKELDDNLAGAKALARQVGDLFKSGKHEDADQLKEQSAQYKEQAKEISERLAVLEQELQDKAVLLPNLPHATVPQGRRPEDNENIYEEADMASLPKDALPHWDLVKKYDLIDLELGVKVTGAGFPVYKGKGARLQRALIAYFLDQATEAGYTEYEPPIMVNAETAYATGHLPDKEGQMYYVEKDELYLIPTAEVPLTNLYRDVILKEDQFPVKMTGFTPCFRREAGSYGKDVRGLNRLHQFDKVEIVRIEKPENSYAVLEEMKDYVSGLIKKLGLPYRILRLCGGDMSFASALTYDMEVYSGAQEKWLEVSSVSNFETFQSNRLKLRYKDVGGKTVLAHTLNGSALALPRIVAALLENNQSAQGIHIPEVLWPYTGFRIIN